MTLKHLFAECSYGNHSQCSRLWESDVKHVCTCDCHKTGRTRRAKAIRVSYSVDLIGTTWEGFTASYHYTFDSGEPTAEDIRKRAGDFQNVTDYRIVRFTQSGNWRKETTERRLVKDWASEDNAMTFLDCTR